MTARSSDASRTANGMTHAEIRDAATDTRKHCSKCGAFKPLDAYLPDARSFMGRTAKCRRCHADYASNRNAKPDVKARRNELLKRPHMRATMRRRFVLDRYGPEALPVEDRRLAGDGCDVCGGHEVVGIDHCHATGEVRGLLCRPCNKVLGFAGDDPARLRALADYLDRHSPSPGHGVSGLSEM